MKIIKICSFFLLILITTAFSSPSTYAGCGCGSTELPAIPTGKNSMMDLPPTGSHADSLIGNIILSMAYQKDLTIHHLMKKMSRVDNVTLTTLAGVSGLNLSQNIVHLREVSNHNSSDTSHEESMIENMLEEDGDHTTTDTHHTESKAPSIMGIVGSGISLATVGSRAILLRRYTKKINQRKKELQEQVESLLHALHTGTFNAENKTLLENMIGVNAAQEVTALFHILYQNLPSVQVTPAS